MYPGYSCAFSARLAKLLPLLVAECLAAFAIRLTLWPQAGVSPNLVTKIAAVAFPASLFYRRYGVGVTRAPSLHLTIHSSRSLFTGRLNSGVRPLNGVLWGNKVEESKNGGAGNNEPADERDSTSFRPGMDPIRATRDMVLKPKAILGAFLVYGGTAAYLFLGNISSIQELLYTHSRELVAIPLVLIGMLSLIHI